MYGHRPNTNINFNGCGVCVVCCRKKTFSIKTIDFANKKMLKLNKKKSSTQWSGAILLLLFLSLSHPLSFVLSLSLSLFHCDSITLRI